MFLNISSSFPIEVNDIYLIVSFSEREILCSKPEKEQNTTGKYSNFYLKHICNILLITSLLLYSMLLSNFQFKTSIL